MVKGEGPAKQCIGRERIREWTDRDGGRVVERIRDRRKVIIGGAEVFSGGGKVSAETYLGGGSMSFEKIGFGSKAGRILWDRGGFFSKAKKAALFFSLASAD